MTSKYFLDFLQNISPQPLQVIHASIPRSRFVPLDLSKENKELQQVDVTSSSSLSDFINAHIKSNDGIVAFGGYQEIRSIYQRSTHFKEEAIDERNIHLGVDLWIATVTAIYAPIDGMVHSFKNNTNYGDYGPTIILKHNLSNMVFYTLYGHLSLSSIASVEIGQEIKRGDCFAFLGDASVNGDYPPHLHFQIIRDIQDYKGDYPGVCSKQDLDFYAENCPDPNLLLKIR